MHNILGINYVRTSYEYDVRSIYEYIIYENISPVFIILRILVTHMFLKNNITLSQNISLFMFLLLFSFVNVQIILILPGRRYLRLNFQVNDLPQNVQQNS